MTHSRDSQFFLELEAVLDEQFPKGECKERGAALVVFAEANRLHNASSNEKSAMLRQRNYDQKLIEQAEQRGADAAITEAHKLINSAGGIGGLTHLRDILEKARKLNPVTE